MKDIGTRQAVDQVAARVIQPGPKGMEPCKRFATMCSATPPEMRPVLRNALNLVGAKVGWLTVVGLHGWLKGRWVCRCVCGYFVLRSAKAIRNASNSEDRCDRCRHVAFLQRRSQQIASGEYIPQRSENSYEKVGAS